MSVPRRRIGPDGPEVSVLALGSWHTYDRMYFEDAVALVARALEAGIDLFDVGNYGDFVVDGRRVPPAHTDVLFGRIIEAAGAERSDWLLSEKLWLDAYPELTLAQQLDRALVRVGVDHADFVVLGDVVADVDVPRLVRDLAVLVDKGKVGHWGVNNWSVNDLRLAWDTAVTESLPRPQMAQLKYSVVRRAIPDGEPYRTLMAETGITIEASDVLEGGILAGNLDPVVASLARETGAAAGFAMFQLHFVAGLFRQTAALAYAPLGEVIPSDTGAFAMGVRRPVGVVGAIAPWNAALILSARSIAAPLALGNTVVLKPSEWSPQVGGLLWGEILAEAGLPPGVLNVVTHAPGEAQAVGDELIESPHVRRLNFTGSTATGRRLAEAAGRQLKRIVLELGGYNPLIVLADADLDYAVNAAAFGAFLHQGQICMSARRIIVERPIADVFVSRLAEKTAGLKTGDPSEPDTIIGPLINADALATVQERVSGAVRAGATVLAGGSAEGPCFQATLLADVPADSEFANEETFGPVAAIEVVDSAEEAVARANATAYGLSSGIITSDADRGLALAQVLDAGIVHVNDQPVGDEPQMPFGGIKDSGFGRFGGTAVIDEFTDVRWVTVQRGSHPFPF